MYEFYGRESGLGLEFAKEAVNREPNKPGFLDTLACLLDANGDSKASLETFEKALKIMTKEEDITWTKLACVYEKNGKIEEAKKIRSIHQK